MEMSDLISSTTNKEQVKRFCRYQGIMCEYATDMGYCKITGCAKQWSDAKSISIGEMDISVWLGADTAR